MEYRLIIEDEYDNEVGIIGLTEYPTGNANRLAGKIDDLINTHEENLEEEEDDEDE